jgi:Domain of unknown function (DUF1906)
MKAASAPTCLAADTNTSLTAERAFSLFHSTYGGESIEGVCRYVSISQARPGDITLEEAKIITDQGKSFWLIQHPMNPGWTPSLDLGSIHGVAAARNALAAGYAEGSHLGIDIEGIKPGTSVGATQDYIGRRIETGLADGFPPIIYWGYQSILTGEQFWELPTAHLYWSDFAQGRDLPNRGFAAVQFAPNIVLGGVQVDLDRLAPDKLGGTLVWTSP